MSTFLSRIARLTLIASAALALHAVSSPISDDLPLLTRPAATSAAATQQQPSTSACQLRVGYSRTYNFRDKNGILRGLNVDIVRKIFHRIGCQAAFVYAGWKEQLDALRTGKIDIMFAVTITAKRQAFARFSIPYRKESWVLYTRAEHQAEYSALSFKQLLQRHLTLGVISGFVYGKKIDGYRNRPGFEKHFRSIDSSQAGFSALLNGKVDLYIDHPVAQIEKLYRAALMGRIDRLPLVIDGTLVSLMFSKKTITAEQIEAIDRAIRSMRKDGTINHIVSLYINPIDTTKPLLPTVAAADYSPSSTPKGNTVQSPCTISMGFTEPFEFIDKNLQVRGIDADLAREAILRSGCAVTFVRAAWNDQLASLRAGLLDAMTGASITPERRKFAYFSIPYRKEHWALYSTKKNRVRFSKMTLQQLVRTRVNIGLVRGYHYGDTLNKVLKQPSVARKIRYSVTSDFNFSKLIKGDLDLVVEHPFARLSPATRSHFSSKIARLPHYIGGTPIALMFSKKNISKKRIAAIDKALQTMRNEGLTLRTEQQYYNQ